MKGGLPSAPALSLVLAIIATACSTDPHVVLGNTSPTPYHFGTPSPVPELASPARTDNPTLTGDLLEIYFTSTRGDNGDSDVWFAQRATRDQPFGTPSPVAVVNSTSDETSAAISADGLTLWFGSDRPGGLGQVDIWVSARATRNSTWSTPVNLVALNTTASDIPRSPGQHGLVMPMSTTKTTPNNPAVGNYQLYFATRAAPGAPFGTPVAMAEVDYQDRSSVDGCLSGDGLTLFFSSAPLPPAAVDGGSATLDAGTGRSEIDAGVATADLFVAWRRSTDEPFSVTQPLDDLNTAYEERDPWLTPDGKTLYFTSDREGPLNVYRVDVKHP